MSWLNNFGKVSIIAGSFVIACESLAYQYILENPSDIKSAEAGRAVAQHQGYTFMGSESDGLDLDNNFFADTVRGSAYLYHWGQLVHAYKFEGPEGDAFTYASMGDTVALDSEWLAVSARQYIPGGLFSGNPGVNAVFLASKSAGAFTDDLPYSIVLDSSCQQLPMALDGNFLAVGCQEVEVNGVTLGAVSIYQYSLSSDAWQHYQDVVAAENGDASFGKSEITMDGGRLVVGASKWENMGRVYAFDLQSDGSWLQTWEYTGLDSYAGSNFGRYVDLSEDQLIVADSGTPGVSNMGYVQIFEYNGTRWNSVHKYYSHFADVAIYDGMAVASLGQPRGAIGTLITFNKAWNGWQTIGEYIQPNAVALGSSIDIYWNNIAAGARHHDKTAADGTLLYDAGATYVIDFWATKNN